MLRFIAAELTEVQMDYVVLFGKRVDRPSRISRSQWMSHWEQIEKNYA
jgi:hypothetical protein